VQNAQRRAAAGISDAHSVQVFVVGVSSAPRCRRSSSAFIGFTTKRKIASAISRKLISAFRKSPYRTSASPTENVAVEKSGTPTRPSSGVRTSATNDVMTAPNAAPMTTAIARSTTFPRMMNSRNSLTMRLLLRLRSSTVSAKHSHGPAESRASSAPVDSTRCGSQPGTSTR
jgi:hypothetical protein